MEIKFVLVMVYNKNIVKFDDLQIHSFIH